MVNEVILSGAIGIFGTLLGVYVGYFLQKRDKTMDEIYAPLESELMDIHRDLVNLRVNEMHPFWDKLYRENKFYRMADALRDKLAIYYFEELQEFNANLTARLTLLNNFSEKELSSRLIQGKKIHERESFNKIKDVGRYVLCSPDGIRVSGLEFSCELNNLEVPYKEIKENFNLEGMEKFQDYVAYIRKKVQSEEFPQNKYLCQHYNQHLQIKKETLDLMFLVHSELTMFPKITRFKHSLSRLFPHYPKSISICQYDGKWIGIPHK